MDFAYFSELERITNLGAIQKRMDKRYETSSFYSVVMRLAMVAK